jgi:hypothetical protein
MTQPITAPEDDKIRLGLETVQSLIAEEAEEAAADAAENDRPSTWVAGDPDFEGMTGMAEVFQYALNDVTGLVPAELKAAIARMAWGFAASMAETEESTAKFEAEMNARAAERERTERLLAADEYEIRVYGKDVTEEVYVGPFTFQFQAENAAAYLRGVASTDERRRGLKFEVMPYDDTRKHVAGMVPKDPGTLAGIIDLTDSDRDVFPDLFDRVIAFHGEAGRAAWTEAIELLNPERVDAVIG